MKDINNENNHPYVTMIVPVYKVEDYIDKCLECIEAQTYTNLEVILVDDGSPDKCGEICDEYVKNHDNTVVLHQSNQGLSAARNNAVLKAKGEYITFVDSDDYFSPDYVEYLVRLAVETGADVSIGGFKYVSSGQAVNMEEEQDDIREQYGPEETLIIMNYGKSFGIFAWGKLYKKEMVVRHPYPVGKIYEDLATTYKIIGDAGKIAYGSKTIYYWVHRKGSITRSAFDERQMDALSAVKNQLDYISSKYPKAVQAAKVRYTRKVIELMGIALDSKADKTVFNRLKSEMIYWKEFRKDSHVKKTLKLRGMAIKMGYLPAKIVFAVHSGIKGFFYN